MEEVCPGESKREVNPTDSHLKMKKNEVLPGLGAKLKGSGTEKIRKLGF